MQPGTLLVGIAIGLLLGFLAGRLSRRPGRREPEPAEDSWPVRGEAPPAVTPLESEPASSATEPADLPPPITVDAPEPPVWHPGPAAAPRQAGQTGQAAQAARSAAAGGGPDPALLRDLQEANRRLSEDAERLARESRAEGSGWAPPGAPSDGGRRPPNPGAPAPELLEISRKLAEDARRRLARDEQADK